MPHLWAELKSLREIKIHPSGYGNNGQKKSQEFPPPLIQATEGQGEKNLSPAHPESAKDLSQKPPPPDPPGKFFKN